MKQNTLEDFEEFCAGCCKELCYEDKGIKLNENQRLVAHELFSMPSGTGKSLLVALLAAYDGNTFTEHYSGFESSEAAESIPEYRYRKIGMSSAG